MQLFLKINSFMQVSIQIASTEGLSSPCDCFDVKPCHLVKFIFTSSLSEAAGLCFGTVCCVSQLGQRGGSKPTLEVLWLMIEFMSKPSTRMVRSAVSSMPKCLVQALRQA